MACNAGYEWCKGLAVVHTDGERQCCVFHAPAEAKGVTVERFNELVFARIDEAKAADEKCNLSGTIFPGVIVFGTLEPYREEAPPRYGKDNPLPEISFHKAEFKDVAVFSRAQFSGVAYFSDAQFSGEAYFNRAQFSGEASFIKAQFSGEASFIKAEFSGKTDFGHAEFSGKTDFGHAEFSGEASFIKAQFSGEAGFNNAQFSGEAGFNNAQFSGAAAFSRAKFSGAAAFSRAQFSGGAYFSEAQFSGAAWFEETQFSGAASFRGAQFSGTVSFWFAKFSGETSFYSVQFCGKADFRNVTLNKADFRHADMSGVDLEEVDLEDCDLRHARGIKFNQTFVRGARISPNSPDPWSVLRRNYSGTKFFFHLILLIAFILPYAGKTLMWVGINQSQQAITATASSLREAALNMDDKLLDKAREATSALEGAGLGAAADKRLSALEENGMLNAVAGTITKCLAPECETYSVWQVVTGFDKPGYYFWLVLSLMAYNLARATLTWSVGPMREEEERSGYTPEYGSYWPFSKISEHYAQRWEALKSWKPLPEKTLGKALWLRILVGIKDLFLVFKNLLSLPWSEGYARLLWLHYFVELVFWIAAISFVLHFWQWMHLPIHLPKPPL